MNEEIKEEITEEEIFRAWTGKNEEFYYKINNKKFNWCMFFFGPMYLFYRRMNLEAVLYWVLDYILSIILISFCGLNVLGAIVSLLLRIGMSFAFYPMYKWHFKRKMNKYRLEKGYDNEELLTIAKEKGGVSWTVIIILFVIPAIILIIMLIISVSMMVFNSATEDVNYNDVNYNYDTNNYTVTNIANYTTNDSLTNNYAINNNSTNKYGTLYLNDYGYSVKYDQSKWNEIYDNDYKAIKSANDSTVVFYVFSKECDKNIYDFSKYSDMYEFNKTAIEMIKSNISSNDGVTKNDTGLLLTSNNNYYSYVDATVSGAYSRFYIVYEKDKNCMLVFSLMTSNSYIDTSINNEVVNMITNI